jgi:hypothetical protein
MEDRPTCGAQRRRVPGPCTSTVLYPNGRCRVHGGASLVGTAAPGFRSGRYSKYLPARLSERYEEMLADPEALALQDELAVVGARLAGTMLLLGEGGPAGSVQELAGAITAYADVLADGEPELDLTTRRLWEEVLDALEALRADADAWTEAQRLIELKIKLVDAERKRLEALSQSISVAQAMAFVARIADVVKRHVTDPRTLSAIYRDLAGLSGALPGAHPG